MLQPKAITVILLAVGLSAGACASESGDQPPSPGPSAVELEQPDETEPVPLGQTEPTGMLDSESGALARFEATTNEGFEYELAVTEFSASATQSTEGLAPGSTNLVREQPRWSVELTNVTDGYVIPERALTFQLMLGWSADQPICQALSDLHDSIKAQMYATDTYCFWTLALSQNVTSIPSDSQQTIDSSNFPLSGNLNVLFPITPAEMEPVLSSFLAPDALATSVVGQVGQVEVGEACQLEKRDWPQEGQIVLFVEPAVACSDVGGIPGGA